MHWAIVIGALAVVLAGVIAVSQVVRRRAKDPQNKDGLAPIRDVVEWLGARQLTKKHGARMRPSLARHSITAEMVGLRVGTFQKVDVWLRMEDPTIIIGPSRSGKGWYLVLNWLMSAPGALITTSNKMDNVQLTMRARERQRSVVKIFAPGVLGGEDLGHVLRWSPVLGCVDEEVLIRRIRALIPQDSFSGSTSNGGHWDTLGQQLAAHLFHAAACGGRTVDDIWGWVGSPSLAKEAVRLIRDHPGGLAEHANHLEMVLDTPAEQRSTQWAVLSTVLAFLESGAARAWMKPDNGVNPDLADFILQKGTLYLVGDKKTSKGYVRIIDGLLGELDYITIGLADASPGSRLDPPVTYLLDEAGNFEYQGLPELITAGGGRGRVGVCVFQSRSQMNQWSNDEADTMWDAAVAKIILPGGASDKELSAMSSLIGDLWVERESFTHQGVGQGSVNVGEEKRAVMEASEIRTLASGYALLFYRHLKPVIVKLTPFDTHPQWDQMEAEAKEVAKVLATKSPFAAQLKAFKTGRTDA